MTTAKLTQSLATYIAVETRADGSRRVRTANAPSVYDAIAAWEKQGIDAYELTSDDISRASQPMLREGETGVGEPNLRFRRSVFLDLLPSLTALALAIFGFILLGTLGGPSRFAIGGACLGAGLILVLLADRFSKAGSLLLKASAAHDRGDWVAAADAALRHERIARRRGFGSLGLCMPFLVSALVRQGRKADAFAAIETFAKDPYSRRTHTLLLKGTAHELAGEPREAIEAYREIAEVDPACTAGWLHAAGVIAADLGDGVQSRKMLEVVRASPVCVLHQWLIALVEAMVLLAEGHPSAARETLERAAPHFAVPCGAALQSAERSAFYRAALAVACFRSGDLAASRTHYEGVKDDARTFLTGGLLRMFQQECGGVT